MRVLLRQRTTHIAIALLLGFMVLAAIVPPEPLKQSLDYGRAGFALSVFVVCILPAFRVFREGAKNPSDQITVAITLLWFVITFQSFWIPINRDAPLPPWVPRDAISALVPYLYMISAAFFLIPIGNIRETPSGNWPMIAAAGALGGLVIGLALGFGINSTF